MSFPQELVNVRDNLEKQLHTVTLQLGKVEEQRILAVADMEKMRVCNGLGDVWMRGREGGREGRRAKHTPDECYTCGLGCAGGVRQAVRKTASSEPDTGSSGL